jgi:hypothetical protein
MRHRDVAPRTIGTLSRHGVHEDLGFMPRLEPATSGLGSNQCRLEDSMKSGLKAADRLLC